MTTATATATTAIAVAADTTTINTDDNYITYYSFNYSIFPQVIPNDEHSQTEEMTSAFGTRKQFEG